MVRTAKDWPWSSYRATTGQIASPEWLYTDWVLSGFAKQKKTAIALYKSFVIEGKNQPSPWEKLKNQIFLGTDKFIQDMQSKISRGNIA